MVSQLLRVSAHLDGVLLEAVTVLGVTSPPRRVVANGAVVSDFSYRSDTQVSACPHPGKGCGQEGTQSAAEGLAGCGPSHGTARAMGALPGDLWDQDCAGLWLCKGQDPPWL